MNRTSFIWESIDSRNYKQALQHVTKALKRTPDSDHYLALKAYILSLQRKSDEAVQIARDIASRQPTDSRILDLIFGVILDSQGPTEAGALYESAARKKPKDEDLILSWFWAMCTGGDLRGQQKAAMTLHKSFARRPYTLWALLSCYILAISPIVTPQERTLFLTLAVRFLPLVEPVTTAEEAILKARVLELQPTLDGALEFLYDPATEKYNNLELQIMQLEISAKAKKWENVYNTALKTLLKENRDDYDSWKELANAVMKLPAETERRSAFEDLLTVRSHTRNGALASVYYGSLRHKDDLMAAAKQYFNEIGSKQCAFEDLKPFASMLDPEAWLSFLDEQIVFKDPLSRYSVKQLNALVNNRKFHYLLDHKDESYVKQNIELYNALLPTLQSKSVTDYYVGDDLLLLAACWILEERPMAEPVSKADSVYAVIVLLETACSRDPHQFYVRLWLTRLYLYVGSFQQATVHYNRLSIKNIQTDVLSHFLLTRVSSIHPAYKTLMSTRDCYDMNAVETPQNIKRAYESSAFSQIAGFMEFSQRMSDSVNKGILVIEAKRTARMLGLKMEGLTINPMMAASRWCDNRDYGIVFDVSMPGEKTTEEKYRPGPKQNGGWINAFIFRESLLDNLTAADNRANNVDKLKAVLEPEQEAGLTEAERFTLSTAMKLAAVAGGPNLEGLSALQTFLADGVAQLCKTSQTALNWEWFHNRYTVMETVKTTIYCLDQLALVPAMRRNGKLTASVAMIKKQLLDAGNSIKEDAKNIKLGREIWAREIADRVSAYPVVSDLDTSTIDVASLLESVAKSHEENLTMLRNVRLI
ncbi:N-acetyltransferase B complex non catalytic subunit-domain-containing protein [Lipomyces arxii]|uniref:N-acetyltransferase B complex non catalytic subunit-domain-containing protein n=1 Tax=Lipomyces arxii TaxID=56418 RepID=UPI0034CF364A